MLIPGCLDATGANNDHSAMGNAARKLLDTFDTLPPEDRQEVVREILRRSVVADHGFPEDDEFVGAATAVFLDLERDERRE